MIWYLLNFRPYCDRQRFLCRGSEKDKICMLSTCRHTHGWAVYHLCWTNGLLYLLQRRNLVRINNGVVLGNLKGTCICIPDQFSKKNLWNRKQTWKIRVINNSLILIWMYHVYSMVWYAVYFHGRSLTGLPEMSGDTCRIAFLSTHSLFSLYNYVHIITPVAKTLKSLSGITNILVYIRTLTFVYSIFFIYVEVYFLSWNKRAEAIW